MKKISKFNFRLASPFVESSLPPPFFFFFDRTNHKAHPLQTKTGGISRIKFNSLLENQIKQKKYHSTFPLNRVHSRATTRRPPSTQK